MIEDRWVEAYKGYLGSGETQREYCRQKGIKFTQFKTGIQAARVAGRIRLKSRGRLESESARSSGFLAIQIAEEVGLREVVREPISTQSSTTSPYCEIRLNGKAGIRIETEAAMGFWIETMRGLCR